MKKLLLIILLTAITFSLSSADKGDMEKKIFSSYISVQKALAADNPIAAKEAFKNLMLSSKGELNVLSKKAFEAKDIKEMRLYFKNVSTKVAILKQPDGYGTAYCPMAKSWWVQEEGKIANPYFGKKMLTCGSFKEYKKENNPERHIH